MSRISSTSILVVLLICGGIYAQPNVTLSDTSVFFSHQANMVGQLGAVQFFAGAQGCYAFNTTNSDITHIACDANLFLTSNGLLYCLKGNPGNYQLQYLNSTTYSVVSSFKFPDSYASHYGDLLNFYGVPETLTNMSIYNLATQNWTYNGTVPVVALENLKVVSTQNGVVTLGTNPVSGNSTLEFYNTQTASVKATVNIDEINLIGLEVFNGSNVAAAFYSFESFDENMYIRIVPIVLNGNTTSHGKVAQVQTLEAITPLRPNYFKYNDTHFVIFTFSNGFGTVGLYHFDANLNLVQGPNITVPYNFTISAIRNGAGTNFAYLYVSNDNVKFLDYLTIDVTTMTIVGGYMGNAPVLLNNGSLLYFGYSGLLVSNKAQTAYTYTYLPVTDFFYDSFNDGLIWGFYLPATLVVPLNYTCYLVQVSIAQSSVGVVEFESCPCPAPFDGKNYLQDITLTEFGDLYVTYTCANLEVRVLENFNTVYSFDTALSAPVYVFPNYQDKEVNIVNLPDCRSKSNVTIATWNLLTGTAVNSTSVYFSNYCNNDFQIAKISNNIMTATNISAKQSATTLAFIDITTLSVLESIQYKSQVGSPEVILYTDPFAIEQFQVFVGHTPSSPQDVVVSDINGNSIVLNYGTTPYVSHVSNTQFTVKLVFGDIGFINVYTVTAP